MASRPARKLEFGDIYIFYCQQVHGSPIRRDDTLRLSVEVRAVACRSLDDNTGYRRIFSNLNNFLSADETDDGDRRDQTRGRHFFGTIQLVSSTIPRRKVPVPTFVRSFMSIRCFRRRSSRGKPKKLAQSPGHLISARRYGRIPQRRRPNTPIDFPSRKTYVLLARLFLRRGEDETAATIIGEASQQSQSYFWQLHFAYLAIRAHRKDVARTILAALPSTGGTDHDRSESVRSGSRNPKRRSWQFCPNMP